MKPGPRPSEVRRAQVLTAIVRYVAAHRVPPTLEELSHELGCGLTVVHRWIERLEAEGAVESLWVAGRRSPRSLRVAPSRQLELLIS